MKRRRRQYNYLYFLMVVLLVNTVDATINFRGNSAYIRVQNGANFTISNPILGYNGTLMKDSGGTITGQTVSFVDGILADNQNNLILYAVLNPSSNIITLSGNQSFNGQYGVAVESLNVSGSNNLLQGAAAYNNPITLQDVNTTLTVMCQHAINQNIVLNNGTINLNDNLSFSDGKQFTGTGTIYANGYGLTFGGFDLSWSSTINWYSGDIRLNSQQTLSGSAVWAFNGTNRINGNGNIIDLSAGGILQVPAYTTLYLDSVTIKGLGASGGQLSLAATSSLILSNVSIELVGNITTSAGTVIVKSPSTVIVKNNTWTFNNSSLLQVIGVTLSMDQAGAPTAGSIAFGSSAINESLVNYGTLAYTNSNLSSTVSALQTSTGYLQTEINALSASSAACCTALATSTGYLQTQITNEAATRSIADVLLQNQISLLNTSTTSLETQIVNEAATRSTADVILQNQITTNLNTLTAVQTSTGYLQTQINAISGSSAACCSALATSTGILTNTNN